MIKIEKINIEGWSAAIRGMRNPKNSWDKSDTIYGTNYGKSPEGIDIYEEKIQIGKKDLELMTNLIKAGSEHRKFLRMITVTCDVTAPLYWWKEYDTYKVGTVANSCSTMHKVMEHVFTKDDFSCEHLIEDISVLGSEHCGIYMESFNQTLWILNRARQRYIDTGDKKYWWYLIQLLPSSYNQKRTIQLSYETILSTLKSTSRYYHKLDEWNGNVEGSWCATMLKLSYMLDFLHAMENKEDMNGHTK